MLFVAEPEENLSFDPQRAVPKEFFEETSPKIKFLADSLNWLFHSCHRGEILQKVPSSLRLSG